MGPILAASAVGAVLAATSPARAADDASGAGVGAQSTLPKSAPNETPVTAFTYGTGVSAGTVGASSFGSGVAGTSASTWAAGATAWASPIDRLTLVVDATRSIDAQFSPSAAAIIRLLGRHDEGFSFGVLEKFKIDGFARGPNREVESELESGAVLSYVHARVHADLNGLAGFGLADDHEVDTEARLRVGYDLTRFLRVGVDEQARWRLRGFDKLPGGRTWDFGGGAQVLLSWKNFYGAVTAGPTTIGVVDPGKVGWMGMLTLGAVTL